MAPEISPPGRLRPQKQRAAGGADRERFEHVEGFGAAGNGKRHRCGNRLTPPYGKSARRDKCASATAAMRASVAERRHWPSSALGVKTVLARSNRFRDDHFDLAAPSFAAFLHSDGISCAPCRAGPWHRLPSSIRARLRCAFSAFLSQAPFRRQGPAGAVVCANAEPSGTGMRRRSRPRGKISSSWSTSG